MARLTKRQTGLALRGLKGLRRSRWFERGIKVNKRGLTKHKIYGIKP